jgi:hypothetical protein
VFAWTQFPAPLQVDVVSVPDAQTGAAHTVAVE